MAIPKDMRPARGRALAMPCMFDKQTHPILMPFMNCGGNQISVVKKQEEKQEGTPWTVPAVDPKRSPSYPCFLLEGKGLAQATSRKGSNECQLPKQRASACQSAGTPIALTTEERVSAELHSARKGSPEADIFHGIFHEILDSYVCLIWRNWLSHSLPHTYIHISSLCPGDLAPAETRARTGLSPIHLGLGSHAN